MSFLGLRRQNQHDFARGVFTIRKGIGFLQAGDFDSALGEFRRVTGSKNPNTSRLVKAVANGYAYHAERFRKETKKVRYGNANLLDLSYPANSGEAWSDVDIAMVLVAPTNAFTTRFLASFLGLPVEDIRFQRRYVFDAPLHSWSGEEGKNYTRFTQNQRVARRLELV